MPLPPAESLWIGLQPLNEQHPTAVRVAVRVPSTGKDWDAVTGVPFSAERSTLWQDYVVSPPQRAIYGVTVKIGSARQIVRAGGMDVSPSTDPRRGALEIGHIRLVAMPCLRGVRVPVDVAPPMPLHGSALDPAPARGVGGADKPGLVPQIIHPDPIGRDAWDADAAVSVVVHLVSPEEFARRSGQALLKPLDVAHTYRGWRLPP